MLIFSSCRKDDIVDTSTNPPAAEVFYAADIIGKIVDQDGKAIEDATITVGNASESTDANGLFRWKGLNMGANIGTFLEVNAPGYFESGYRIYPGGTYDRNVEITLVKKVVSGYVNGTTGDVITLEGGLEVDFPANAFVANGGDYNGLVTVHAYHVDPSEEGYLDRSPGDLSGTDETGANYLLESFGMLAVEMETPDGQYVQLREGVTATITVPVDNSLLGDAPPVIPLWHFDDIQHKWVKEGQAELINGKYIGQVSHFSWWNCDDFIDAASLCIQIFDGRFQGSLYGLVVELTSESAGTSSDITDSEGNASGQVPSGEVLEVTVYGLCGEVVYTGSIGPFTGLDNKEIIPVTLAEGDQFEFTGNVFDCETMSSLSDAIVTIDVEGRTSYTETDENGNYAFSLLMCEEEVEYVVSAFNLEAGMAGVESGTATLLGANVLNVSLCDEIPFGIISYGSDGEQVTVTDLTASQKPNEIILSNDGATGLVIGFSATTVGTSPASIYSTFVNADNTNCSVTLTQFESGIGGYIEGSIVGTNEDGLPFYGTFAATITQ